VTNGDTITLRATSPVAGQEDNVAVTVGASSGFTWKVRTVGNNTVYAFVTSRTWTGQSGRDHHRGSGCANVILEAAGGGPRRIVGCGLLPQGLTTGNGPVSREFRGTGPHLKT
jgi:hypothetical protein